MARILRAVGWTLIAGGTLVLLYVVYLLAFTNITTERAQEDLLATWQAKVGALPLPAPGAAPDALARDGDAYAALWFKRPGSAAPIVREGPLFIVDGIEKERLKRGPGHYPATASPGSVGNFAVAGHRTTYGAPFYHLDQLGPGDRVHVVDRQGREWIYVVRTSRIVDPGDVWVLGHDPLGTGEPTMTMTTCHPRFSAARRLVVFSVLL
ncbi:MAG: sortase [Nitriliruptorales bacterium]